MRVLTEAFGGIRRAPLLTGTAAAMIGLVFFTLGVFGLVAHNVQSALRGMQEGFEVVVFLRDDAGAGEIDALRAELAALPAVAEVAFVSKDAALERARTEFPGFEELFGSMEAVNPLPRSLEVSVESAGGAEPDLELVSRTALRHPFVEDAGHESELLGQLAGLRRIAALAALALGGVFATVAGLITASALRIVIFARRDEIYIMRLVGARDSYVRGPFVAEGALVGLLGGCLASLLTWGSHELATRLLFPIAWFGWEWAALGALAAAAFGIFSSMLAIRGRLEEPSS